MLSPLPLWERDRVRGIIGGLNLLRAMLRAKIHRATVTESNLEYEGSLTVDEVLMEAVGILPYEQVVVSNLNNGERFVTYVIPGKKEQR